LDEQLGEPYLRQEACRWLKENFPSRRYQIEPTVFHDIGLTLSEFVRKKFKGEQLTRIPKYQEISIRPDIIALLITLKNQDFKLGWIISECKVGKVNVADFRQALHYANIAEAYNAYLFYFGELSREVLEAINKGGHLYTGTNKWGRTVKKRLIFVKYENNRFIKKSFNQEE